MDYGVVSLAAFAVDMSLLKVLVDRAHWHYLPASAAAFVVGAGIAYGLSARFVFARSRMRNRAVEFFCFTALGLVGLLVNAIVLSIAVRMLGIGPLTAKTLASGCTFLTNFALRRSLIFAP